MCLQSHESFFTLDVMRLPFLPVRRLYMYNRNHASTSRNSPQHQHMPAAVLSGSGARAHTPTGTHKTSSVPYLIWRNAPLWSVSAYNEAEQLWGERQGYVVTVIKEDNVRLWLQTVWKQDNYLVGLPYIKILWCSDSDLKHKVNFKLPDLKIKISIIIAVIEFLKRLLWLKCSSTEWFLRVQYWVCRYSSYNHIIILQTVIKNNRMVMVVLLLTHR